MSPLVDKRLSSILVTSHVSLAAKETITVSFCLSVELLIIVAPPPAVNPMSPA